MYIYIYIYIYMRVCIYIYREREILQCIISYHIISYPVICYYLPRGRPGAPRGGRLDRPSGQGPPARPRRPPNLVNVVNVNLKYKMNNLMSTSLLHLKLKSKNLHQLARRRLLPRRDGGRPGCHRYLLGGSAWEVFCFVVLFMCC